MRTGPRRSSLAFCAADLDPEDDVEEDVDDEDDVTEDEDREELLEDRDSEFVPEEEFSCLLDSLSSRYLML